MPRHRALARITTSLVHESFMKGHCKDSIAAAHQALQLRISLGTGLANDPVCPKTCGSTSMNSGWKSVDGSPPDDYRASHRRTCGLARVTANAVHCATG